MQMIFQDPQSSLNPRMTVGQLAAEPYQIHHPGAGRKELNERVELLLAQVGLGINAARQGMESKIFYSFMGLNMVMQRGAERAKFFPPGVMGAIPGMSSIATGMMKKKIEQLEIMLEDFQVMGSG